MEIAMVRVNNYYDISLDEIGLPTRWIGNVPLFNKNDCITLINYCEQNGFGILGMEGFNLLGNSRVPNMDAIVDFSELMNLDQINFKEKSVSIARDFVSNFYDAEIEFELVLIK
ncbi:hypothetical protein MKD49_15675 [Herbaspirillum sp. WGmk3]|uniref:hypothetical protein n=1 Tax=Herbaspirillum sp. WGmk3 TaxID=2919925 RepID=UPI0020903E20|nr:hypothetical protein [Herbaspirillum sp. WGmk3]MCO4857928.1 hypothetical protein [Herbaspirillum sp. WGmk3]